MGWIQDGSASNTCYLKVVEMPKATIPYAAFLDTDGNIISTAPEGATVRWKIKVRNVGGAGKCYVISKRADTGEKLIDWNRELATNAVGEAWAEFTMPPANITMHYWYGHWEP